MERRVEYGRLVSALRAWPRLVVFVALALGGACSVDRKGYSFDQGGAAGTGGAGESGAAFAGRGGSGGGGGVSGKAGSAGNPSGGGVAVCTLGSKRCMGSIPQDCAESGQWVLRHAGCATACLDGECVGCAEGDAVCKDGAVQTCTAGRWATAEVCDSVCEEGECVAECTESRSQCSGSRRQTCVGGIYVDDTQCQFLCKEGECTGECMPDSRRCNPDAETESQSCDVEGLWGAGKPCPADTFCVAGDCKPCSPGAMRCSDAGPQECSESGEWVNKGACVAPLAACLDGACVTCSPGEQRCGDGAVEECQADGAGWEVVETCSGDTPVCLDETKTCGRCTEGDVQCFNSEVQTCDDQGKWETTSTCSGSSPRCVGSACAECDPVAGERRCETANSAQGCSATGTWSLATTCSGDKPLCREDLNFSCGCEEGEKRCRNAMTPEVCQGGSWVAQSNCSGVLNHCLASTGECVDCVPGTTECQSGTAYECTAEGAWRSLNSCAGPGINCGGCDLGEPCQQTSDCGSGFCVNNACAVCQPGQRRCDANVPQLCSNAGAWTNQPACAGTTPQCLASTGLCVECLTGSRACGTCSGGTQSCNASNQWGACTNQPDLQSSNAHCGTCNNACGSGRSCQSGTCQCNSGTHLCGSTCYSNTDADKCGSSCLDCSTFHGTKNTCSSNQCACTTVSLACGSSEPTCGSWAFASGNKEGWKRGTYYPLEEQGTTGDPGTLLNNGTWVLVHKFDNRNDLDRHAAEFTVDLCPGAALVDMSNYKFSYDLYLKTTTSNPFTAADGVADTFLVSGSTVALSCQPFLVPGSDKWEPGVCGLLPASMKSIGIVVRFTEAWAGDIYIRNPRFELR